MVHRGSLNNRYSIIFLAITLFYKAGYTEEIIFTTWDNFEVDKCASVWLIKRFIASSAQIIFYPRGELSTGGIPFDTPDAKFRRYQNKSTFETLLEYYKIEDKKAIYIGRIIHDIEINIWEKKAIPETSKVIDEVNKIRNLTMNDQEVIIQSCLSYFDTFDLRL